VQEITRHSLLGHERELDLPRTIRNGREALIGLILDWRLETWLVELVRYVKEMHDASI
jgi:hypothetical protein